MDCVEPAFFTVHWVSMSMLKMQSVWCGVRLLDSQRPSRGKSWKQSLYFEECVLNWRPQRCQLSLCPSFTTCPSGSASAIPLVIQELHFIFLSVVMESFTKSGLYERLSWRDVLLLHTFTCLKSAWSIMLIYLLVY